MMNEDWDNLKKYLDMIVVDSQRNIKNLIYLDAVDAEKYVEMEPDWNKSHNERIDLWEPIYWLGREYLPWGIPRKLYVDSLEKYALLFSSITGKIASSETYLKLQRKAEIRLQMKCESLLQDIEDMLTEPDTDEKILLIEKEKYESMYEKSRKRLQKNNKVKKSL